MNVSPQANIEPLPAGPRASAWRQLFKYSLKPLEFLEDCRRTYGERFTLRLAGYGTYVLLTDPRHVKEVFMASPTEVHSGEGNEFLSVTVGKTSVIVLDEEPHARQRRVLLPPLKGERMRAFNPAMQAAALQTAERWPCQRPISVNVEMRQVTLRVILQAVTGLPAGPEIANIERQVDQVLSYARGKYTLISNSAFPIGLLSRMKWLPYFRQLAELDRLLYRVIQERRKTLSDGEAPCMLNDLLNSSHADGSPLADHELRDAVVTMLMAGHETTAGALAWAMCDLAENPDLQTRLRAELQGAQTNGAAEDAAMMRLPLLEAFIKESLRLHTLLPFVVRKTQQPLAIGGHVYPAGIVLTPCIHLIHRREDLYPNPEQLRPERFLERKFAPNEWLPFGGGNRICVGMAFALYEMQVVLATLLSRYVIERARPGQTPYVRSGITLVPKYGGQVLVRPLP